MIRQLSVFVENKPGSLTLVTRALEEAGVNIRAFASFDTPEFGILRLIVDKPEQAKEELTHKGFVVRMGEVIGAELEDRRGSLRAMLELLAVEDVNVNYVYSFVLRGKEKPVLVLHTEEMARATEVLKEGGISIIKEEEL